MSNKPIAFLAEKYIEGLDDPATMRLVVNKRWGETFSPQVEETVEDDWRALKGDYLLGEAPSWVRFLTAGQDSRTIELHWCVWGWGLRRNTAGQAVLCGALVDYGVVKRAHTPTIEPEDLAVMDQLLYDRSYPTKDGRSLRVEQGYHDAGWCPVAVYEYSRMRDRAYATRGAATDSNSTTPPVRWTTLPGYEYDGELFKSEKRMTILNTYRLKGTLFGLVKRRVELEEGGGVKARLELPRDVGDEWISQASSERLVSDKRKLVWKKKRANHWSDCNVYAYSAAINLGPLQEGRTKEEQEAKEKGEAERNARKRASRSKGVGTGRRVRRKY